MLLTDGSFIHLLLEHLSTKLPLLSLGIDWIRARAKFSWKKRLSSMPQPRPNIGTYKFQLSSGNLLDYLFICLLITINILQGTRLRGITVGLIYRGTEMSRVTAAEVT